MFWRVEDEGITVSFCLLIGFKAKRNLPFSWVEVVLQLKVVLLRARLSLKLGSFSFTEIGRQGCYPPWWFDFKQIAHRSLRKIALGCKTTRRLKKKKQKTYWSGRERVHKFSKVNTLRKVMRGTSRVRTSRVYNG